MSKYVLDEGVESFEIEVKNRKKPIVVTFCPTDEKLPYRYKQFFENMQSEVDKMQNVQADEYGKGKDQKDQTALDKFQNIIEREIDVLLDYEGNGKELFGNRTPFRATKNGYWLEQVLMVLSDIIIENAPQTMERCNLTMSERGKKYAAKYLK